MAEELDLEGKVLDARVRQKKDTLANWDANELILLDGEQAFVVDANGQPINFKIGDGTKKFADLPYWIAYDQGQYVAITGTALPTPTATVGYSIVPEGTYTRAGQANVVVPAGSMGVLNFGANTWSLGSSVPLPVDPNSVKKDEVVGEASSNIYNYAADTNNFYINNTGDKVSNTGAKMGVITLTAGQTHVTFNLDKDPAQAVNKYYGFYDTSDVKLTYGVANSNAAPTASVTVAIPTGATKLYFTTKNTNEVDTIRPKHMVNYGQTALPFIPYNGSLSKVGDKSLADYAKKSEVATPALVDQKIGELDIPTVDTDNLPNPNILKSINRHINWFISTTPNAGISFGSNWAIWFFPITEITKMTISGWLTTRAELAFFSGTMPSTPSTGVNPNVIRSGTLGQLGIPAKVSGQTTFTPPAGSTWGAVTIKGTAEAADVYSQIMIVYGTVVPPYVNGDDYTPVATKLDANDISAKFFQDDQGNQLSFDELKEAVKPTVDSTLKISGDGQYINVSYPYLGGTMLHKVWAFKPLAADYPNVIDFNDVFFDGTLLHDQTDVVAPFRIEGTTLGANHSYYKTRVTASAHGKTNVDVGSVWTDGVDQWVIVNIYDANNFDISSRYANTKLWTGTTLTHVSGATNTTTVNATAKVDWQMYPCFKDRVVKFYVDGKEVTVTGLSELNADQSFVINESYSILRKASIMEWFIANVGTSTKIIQVDGLPIVRASNSYTFKADGNVLMNTSFLALEDIPQFLDLMFNMNNEFVPQTNIKFYVPGTLQFTQSGTTYNFTNLTVLPSTDLPSRLNFTPSRIDNTVKYPNRIVQIGANWGFAMGYLPIYDAASSSRPTNAATKALQISEQRKTYMSAIDSASITSVTKGQYYSVVGYKSYFKNGNETANYVVEDNDFFLWNLDFHTFGIKIINVPSQLIGREFEVFDKTGNVTVYSKQLTSEIQLNVADTSNYGYVVFKVKK